ncbi:MAG: DNA-processing protein DprA [Verrucomicrobiia bacterium]
MTPREAYIALNMVPNVGPVRVRALLEVFGEPQAILAARRDELLRVENIGTEVAQNIVNWRQHVDLDAELARIEKAGVLVVTREDAEYPKHLREIYDPPLALYARGSLGDGDPHAVAIVGSRRTTLYGQEMARKLAYQLARVGVTVVSGAARGIDTCAHRGVLQAKGRTVAVLGCGVDVAYPPENKELLAQIAAKGGAVVSEFPLGTKPDRQTFPMRNRVISGWSLGVVVVEANARSGALITASFAAEQGRQVFAVPGRADSALSKGSNHLIKDGAKLTEDVEDILSEFEYLFPKTNKTERPAEAGNGGRGTTGGLKVSETEQKVLTAIGDEEAVMDEIIRRSGLTTACVSTTLLALEMKRIVKQLPGKVFARSLGAKD